MNASRIQPPSSRWLRPSNSRGAPKPGLQRGSTLPLRPTPRQPQLRVRARHRLRLGGGRGAARDGLRTANGRSRRRISNVAAVFVPYLAEREATQTRGAVRGCERQWAAVSLRGTGRDGWWPPGVPDRARPSARGSVHPALGRAFALAHIL